MKLNVSLTGDPADFGAYYCISKNEKGITRGAVQLFGKQIRIHIYNILNITSIAQFQIFTIIACFQSIERDPNINLPPPVLGGFSPTIIGEQPPDFVGMDDICPPVQNSIQNVLS